MYAAEMASSSGGTSSGGASGSSSGGGWIPEYLVLYTGFAIDPLSAFVYSGGDESIHRHYTVTQTSSSAASGTSYTTDTTYDVDLTIDATVNTDGTWTYTEDVISSYTLTVTAAGASSPASSGSGTFDYHFSASGGATLSKFNYHGWGTDDEKGSTTQTSTSSDADGLTTTETVHEHWSNGDHYSTTVTNTNHIDTGSASGSVVEDEGETATSSASGTYSRTIVGGSVAGTSSASGIEHDSLHYAWKIARAADGTVTASGTGSAHEDTSDKDIYQGSGGYSLTNSGSDGFTETDTGKIHEHGNSASSSWENAFYVIAPDGSAWNETAGSGSSSQSGADHYNQSGSGGYSYHIDGGTVSGTTSSSGSEHDSYRFTTKSTFAGSGWTITGSGSANETSGSHNSYSGGGKYTITSTSADGYTETVDGAVKESGSSDDHADETVGYTLAGDGGSWLETSGSGMTHDTGKDDDSYSGSGGYSHPISGGTVAGTVKEHGHSSASRDEHTTSGLISGTWNTTGSASGSTSSADYSSYSGDGDYSITDTGASGYTETINGSVKESGASSNGAFQEEGFALTAGGSWGQTSGSGHTKEKAFENSSYSGAGPYSYQVEGGSVKGTVNENGYEDLSNAYATLSSFSGGKWDTSGHGHETVSSDDHSSYTGKGSYGSTNYGSGGYVETITGSIAENGASDNSLDETSGYTLNASGSWVQSSGGGKASDTEDNNESYKGSGGYDYPVSGGTVAGTLAESGYADDAADFWAKSDYQQGAWAITASSGSSMIHSGDFDSYQGGGTYTRTDTGGSGYSDKVNGTITEFGSASNTFYQRKEYQPGSASGSWNQTSGSGDTSDRSNDNFSYQGAGTYADPAENTTGTVNENGHDNRTARYSTDLAYKEGAWSSTGHGKQTFSSGDNGSFQGGGPVSVSVSGSGTASGGATAGGATTIQGTLTEHGSSGVSNDETDGYTLNSSGNWVQSSGTAQNTRACASGQSVAANNPYTHAAASGTIDGTTTAETGWGVTKIFTINGTFSGGEWDNGGNGVVTNSTFNDASYDGNGEIQAHGIGFGGAVESVSGTAYENGVNNQSFLETDHYKLIVPSAGDGSGSGDGDASGSGSTSGSGATNSGGSASSENWQQTDGLRTYNTVVENNASYSADGPYSHTVPGGEASGTVIEGGHNDKSSNYTKYVKDNAGDWTTSSGSGTQTNSSGAHWSFSGHGKYTDQATIWPGGITETINGTVTESAGSATSAAQTDDYELDVPTGNWNNTGANGTTSNISHGSVSYSGSGPFSYAVLGGTVSGTLKQSGYSGKSVSLSSSATSNAAGGWNTTGHGKTTIRSGQSLSWAGGGTADYSVDAEPISGTVVQTGDSGQSKTMTLNLAVQGGAWAITGGAGKTSETSQDNFSFNGGGPYAYQIDGGAVNGTFTNKLYDDESSNFGTTSNLVDGAWASTGSGTETSSTGRKVTFNGGGGYDYPINGGTVHGTATENGGSTIAVTQTEKFSLGSSGNWQQTGGSGRTSDSGSASRTFQGGGSYAVYDHGVNVKGNASEHGSDSSIYDYTTKSEYLGGAWQTSGTGSSTDKGHHVHTYAGSGSASSHTSNGADTNDHSASVNESGSDHGTWDYKTKAKYAGSGWSESGSGTASALMSATFIYKDKTSSKDSTSSGGPNGSSQSKSRFNESHGLVDFTLNGSTENYELLNGEWFMSSSGGAEVETEKRTYGTSSSGSGSSVGYSGDYSGGNGTRNASWYSGSYDDHEVDSTKQTTSSHTTAVPGGPKTTTSTASGSEAASGAQDQTGTDGWKEETRMTEMSESGSGSVITSMSAFSSTRAVHSEYKDSTHDSRGTVTVQPASGSGATASGGSDGSMSGGGTASGGTASGGTASGGTASGGTASGGSGSFHVSGNDTVTTVQQWSSGSGSVHSVTGTQSSSYSSAVNYWGFGQDENVRFPATSVFFGPGGASWGVFGEPGELEPGPVHGPLSGTNAGPSPDLTATSPSDEKAVPKSRITPAGLAAAEEASEAESQFLAVADIPADVPPNVLEKLRTDLFEGLLSNAQKSPDAAYDVLTNRQKIFEFLGDSKQAQDRWQQLKTAAETTLGGPLFNSDPPITQAERKKALEMALLAVASYGNPGAGVPDGWREVEVFSPETTNAGSLAGKAPDGFRAVLYERLDAKGEGTGEYVLAFAGTDATQVADLRADAEQALGGMNDQYEHAIDLTLEVKTKYGKQTSENIELAGGHSLGGGLATAAAIVNKLPATVFNPAGVHAKTVARRGADIAKIPKPITVYRVKGEALTSLQDSNFFTWLLGAKLPAPGVALPDTVGTKIVTLYSTLPPWQAVTKHFMDTVVDALKNGTEFKP